MAKEAEKKKEAADSSKDKGSKGKKKREAEEETESAFSKLSQLRPKRRSLLSFIFFLAVCAWVLLFYGSCEAMLKKKKRDCGWPGISETTCRTTACFLSDSKADKYTIEVRRPAGQKLGLEMKPGKKGIAVDGIKDGAVKDHNDKLWAASPDRIRVGDKIVKVDGKSGDDMKALLRDTSKESLSVEVSRPRKGAFSAFVPPGWQSTNFGQAIASPSFGEMVQKFSYIGGLGVACWMVSGYPASSLPLYYLFPAAAVAWQSTGCCYNDGVGRDEPHCFKPEDHTVFEMVSKTWERTTQESAKNLVKGLLK